MIKSSRTTTKVSAVFLATVLIAGTIAISFPSFMIGSAQAQSYYGNGGMDNRYNSYGSDYGKDNSYGSDYGKDNSYDKRSYGNDYGYESQYQPSYKPDYKPQYPSYDKKDDRDKSKDNKSVDIKKIKCNNININLNAAGGSGTTTNGNTTNGDNGNKTDGFKKIDRDGFTFICINNNNNVAAGAGGGGNVTNGADEEEGCEECFDQLTGRVAEALAEGLANGFTIDGLTVPAGTSIEQLCELLDGANISLTAQEVLFFIAQVIPAPTDAEITEVLKLLFCLEDLGIIDLDLRLQV